MGRLDGLSAMVTGGASGFGRGIAEAYAREGAAVMVADINEAGARAVAEALVAAGGRAEAVAVDITDMASLQAAVARTVEAFGGLSTMVANAGIGQRPMRATETPEGEMRRQYEANAVGAALSAQAAVPALRAWGPGASIILTVSAIALTPRPQFCAYGMAKAAAGYLLKSLALDLAPEGIRVNGLYPAVSDTPMFAEFSDGHPEVAGDWGAALPLGRLIKPEDMGAAAVWLASPTEAANMTGHALAIDGGRTI